LEDLIILKISLVANKSNIAILIVINNLVV